MSEQDHLIADLNALNQIALTLNRSIDVHGALNSALKELVELMGLHTGWIFLHDPEATSRWAGRGYLLAAHVNLPPALALDRPQAWRKGCDCQALCNRGELTGAYNEVHCSRLREATGDRDDLVVHASAPLRSGDETLGVLNVAAPDWGAFTNRSLALLTNVGQMMGVALERARLYDLVQAERVLERAALLDLSNNLLGLPDVADLRQYIAGKVRELLRVDACALLLVPPDEPDVLRFQAASGWRDDPVAAACAVTADQGGGCWQVMEEQRPSIVEDTSTAGRHKLPWPETWLAEEEFRSSAVVPLLVDGRSIGILAVDSREPRRFRPEEVRFLQLMANQAAIAIAKARLHEEELARERLEEELALGRQIQLSMLPEACPPLAGWALTGHYEAARQVGGDFYDHFPLPGEPERLGLVIGDVSDKGVPAALTMVMCRTTIRNYGTRGRGPAEVFYWTNRLMNEESRADMFLSAFYGVLNLEDGSLTYANAGHNPPLLRRAAGGWTALEGRGIVLGVVNEVDIEERQITVAPGDALILYTDGVTESLDGSQAEFGVDGLRTAVDNALVARPDAGAEELATAIRDAVARFAGETPTFDDMTLVVIRRLASG